MEMVSKMEQLHQWIDMKMVKIERKAFIATCLKICNSIKTSSYHRKFKSLQLLVSRYSCIVCIKKAAEMKLCLAYVIKNKLLLLTFQNTLSFPELRAL